MATSVGKVALVTGASRGVGKGDRSRARRAGSNCLRDGADDGWGCAAYAVAGVEETATEVTALGGRGMAVGCDHRDDEQTRAAVRRVVDEAGQIDVLVNNVWGGYEYFWDSTPYWDGTPFWDEAGGVTAVSPYPGLVRTESVLRAAELIDLINSESPAFVGRAVAALAADPNGIRHTGTPHLNPRPLLHLHRPPGCVPAGAAAESWITARKSRPDPRLGDRAPRQFTRLDATGPSPLTQAQPGAGWYGDTASPSRGERLTKLARIHDSAIGPPANSHDSTPRAPARSLAVS